MKRYDNNILKEKIKRKNKISTIAKILFYSIVIVLFAFCMILLIQKIVNPEENPSLFGYRAFVVVTGSMDPTLKIGDIVVTQEIEQENINEGDIITYIEGKTETVTHRVVDIIEEEGKIKYQTKGDNNNSVDDQLVEYEKIEGIYKFKIGKLGNIILKMQNVIVIAVVIIIIYIIYKIIQRKEERKQSRHQLRKEYEKYKKEK